MTNSSLEKTAGRAKTSMIAIFILLLWLPTMDLAFRWDKTPEVNEKRALAPFPSFSRSLAGARSFIAGLEAYFNDHFGFRKRLIYWDQRWKRVWFGESPVSNVIIGQKGWLYYSDRLGAMDLRTKSFFSPGELQDWKSLLEGRRDWLARRGIPYIFVIAPDKQTIYPEYLPEWERTVGSMTKLDQFVAYMKTNSTVEILDLRPALLRAKAIRRTYQYTDSHWSEYGDFVACQELVQLLRRQLPNVPSLSLEFFDMKTTVKKGGNLAYMLAALDTMPEKDYVSLLPRAPLKPLLDTRDTKNSRIVQCVENPDCKGRMVIFGDSFAEGWFPFIGYCFNRVILYRLYDRAGGHVWDTTMIEKEKPDLVVDEILENLLDQEDAGKIKVADALK